MFQEIKNPISSNELEELLKKLYGDQISIEMFVEATLEDKSAKISLIIDKTKTIGYLNWLVEQETEEEEEGEIKKISTILAIDEIVIIPNEQSEEKAIEVVKALENLAKSYKCSITEITVPSQSFWLIPVLVNVGLFRVAILRVSKELEKRTEFVGIFNKVNEGLKPDIIELMISKENIFQLEIIEEPTDYKKILETGYNPEIVSMIFNIEENEEEMLNKVNELANWQEFSFSLIKHYK